MRAVQLDPIAVPFSDNTVKLAGVHWKDNGTTVIDLISKGSGRRARVEFLDDCGLRILDELDLASMWIGAVPGVFEKTWLFEVHAGGWFDLEATRHDFYTKHESPIREFLVTGYRECVSILSRLEPTIVEMDAALDV